jgi:transcriptional regulator with XRE-family HTH domain
MELTQTIINAINHAIKNSKVTAKEFARKTGVSESNLSRWRKRSVYRIDSNNWRCLYPAIRPYLPDDYSKETVPKSSSKPISRNKIPEYIGNIVNGQINIYGVPHEKIIEAINAANLTEEQRKDLKDRIFS